MSQLLDSVLAIIGDPNRPDLLQVTPLVLARLRDLPKEEQLKLRREVTKIRETLIQGTDAWYCHNIVFRYLLKLTDARLPETEDDHARRAEISRSLAAEKTHQGNGTPDAYPSAGSFTPEEVLARHPVNHDSPPLASRE